LTARLLVRFVSDEVFGLEPRAEDPAAHRALAARQEAAGRHHKTKGRAEIARTGAKMFKQKGGGPRSSRFAHRSSAVVARRTVRSFAQPRPRSSQEGSCSGPASCAVGQGKSSDLIVVESLPLAKPRPRR
jgi:large subunit ribosomal protein L4